MMIEEVPHGGWVARIPPLLVQSEVSLLPIQRDKINRVKNFKETSRLYVEI
jgi:hypothetical protein